MNYCKGCPKPIYPVEIPNPSKPVSPKAIFVDSNDEDFVVFKKNNSEGFIAISYQDAKNLQIYLTTLIGENGYVEKLLYLIEYYKPEYKEEP